MNLRALARGQAPVIEVDVEQAIQKAEFRVFHGGGNLSRPLLEAAFIHVLKAEVQFDSCRAGAEVPGGGADAEHHVRVQLPAAAGEAKAGEAAGPAVAADEGI